MNSQTPSPSSDTPSAAAWGFVLQNARVIQAAAYKLWTDRRVEREDFHHDLIIDIARNHHKFDPARSAPSTWVWLRARSVKDHKLRALSCRKDRQHGVRPVLDRDEETGSVIDPAAEAWGCHEVTVARVELSQVLRHATPLMQEAAASHLQGWTGEEVREAFGVTLTARNDRLRRLGKRVANGA